MRTTLLLLVAATSLAYTSAFFINADGRQLRRHVQRDEISDRCDQINAAAQSIRQAALNISEYHLEYLAGDFYGNVRINLRDPVQIRTKSCELADVTNLAEFAVYLGAPESAVRRRYPGFVATVRSLVPLLLKQIATLPEGDGGVGETIYIQTFIDFIRLMDDLGYLNLS